MTIVVAMLDPQTEAASQRLQSMLPAGFDLITAKSRDPADQLEVVKGATFIISGDPPITRTMLEVGTAGPLRAVHRWGVGYDNIDLDAAREMGVRVFRTTGVNAIPVAETAVALMLAVNRNIVVGHLGLLDGKWLKGKMPRPTVTLSRKTVGLLGVGHIGQKVAKLLTGFDCTLLYHKPTPLDPTLEAELKLQYVGFDELIERSDVLSVHCPRSPQTMGLVGAEAISRMKKGSIIVNTARGGIVDEAAVQTAVASGHLRGAALDVFEVEPLPADNALIGQPGFVMTPHIAAGDADGYTAVVNRMIGNFISVLEGSEPSPIDVLC